MNVLIAFAFAAAAQLSGSSSLVATDVIRAGDMVTTANVQTESGDVLPDSSPLIGREVRRTVYAGQAVTLDDTRPVRLVKRNQMVTLKFVTGGLEITTTGRAMGEAAADEPVAVVNLNARKIVNGIVQKDGWVLVQ